MRKTTNFNGNSHFLGIRKVLNLSLKPETQLQKENHTEDWALQSCAKIIEKTVKNGLLSLATSNLKLF